MDALGRKVAEPKTGEEPFLLNGVVLPINLIEFWRWTGSDLLSNATRGILAEFIVAKALGCDTRLPRDEWGSFDLTSPEGIKVEVKSAAYLQSWNQPSGLSKISFSIKEALPWDADTNVQGKTKRRYADVYVFCLLKHVDKATVDPLDLDQWCFFVLSIQALNDHKRSRYSITLKSLTGLANEIGYADLRQKVIASHHENGPTE